VRTSEGNLVPRARVRWRLATGGGSLRDSVTLSDGLGRAQVDFVLSATPGPHTVSAELSNQSNRSVTFSAIGTAPPTLTAVSAAQVTGGDVITLTGTALSAAALVEIGGAPARVTAGSATSVTAMVPACLVPGQVNVRVRVDGGYSNTLSTVFAASGAPVALAVGEYASIDPAALAGCATFPTAGAGGAEYLLAPQAVAGSPGVSASYRLEGDSVVQVVVSPFPEPDATTAAGAFHAFLRGREREMAEAPRIAAAPPAGPAVLAPPVQTNDRRTFRVCARIECTTVEHFPEVQARARFVGDHVALFVDEAAPANGFTDLELQAFGATFDDVLYDVDTRAFGVESDVDENGLVFVLLTPKVNGLTETSQCQRGVITGFFYAIDIEPQFASDQRANQAEIFYGLVPDPSGTVTCAISKDQARRALGATFVHEFQHMISYHQHALLRNQFGEQVWLNEAMSHLAEELGALAFRDAGDQQAFSEYAIGNLYNAFQYLKAPGAQFLAYDLGTGTLAERGSGWLFLR
jgi:hypothetical protein